MSPLSDAAPSGSKPPFIKSDTSGKRKHPGRKPGHKGESRKKPEEAEINGRKEHRLKSCPQCGESFSGPTGQRRRYIIDIRIPDSPEKHEHSINQYWCSKCSCMREPAVSDALPGYSIGIKTIVYGAYMHYYQGLSISKVVENIKIMGLKISPGALVGAWKSLAELYAPFYNEILAEVRNTKGSLHADETGYREHGKKRWLWVFCTRTSALFVIRPVRSAAVVLEILGKSFGGILITDFWKPYLSVIPRLRQWCVAHYLREFKKIEFRLNKPPPEYWKFKKKVIRLFKDALSFSKRKKITVKERLTSQNRFLKRLDGIVLQNYTDKDVLRLTARLKNYREGFFTFVLKKDVDATNNHGERTLRFAVINRKMQFHTMSAEGSAVMEVMMSVFKTLDLRGLDVFEEAVALARNSIIEVKYTKSDLAA